MALLLHERALEDGDSRDLVRLTTVAETAPAFVIESLIPNRPLAPGEQYRFHFDMTRCIGCRSCEIACNEQNGNPADIKWRRVGELEGGIYPFTQRTYLSMGCNHCLSADCLSGCPVDAYTKDPLTGIVLHSADACIGCQYCVWNCPYSVPQFNPERGVVGKCDMCRGRLLDGLEPACANACPENAIKIEIVNQAEWRNDYATAESPGMPPAGQTISTTRITLPANSSSWLERVDTGTLSLEHSHPSLVIMTTAMQAAFGTLIALWLQRALDTVGLILLLLLTALALNVAVFHLGRPAYAWRALRMWRRSWLSREVLCFGLFFSAVAAYATTSWLSAIGIHSADRLIQPLASAAIFFGLCGMIASAQIYRVKARPAWNMIHTPIDFLLSAGMLGSSTAAAMRAPANLLLNALQRFHPHLHAPSVAVAAHTEAVFAFAWILNILVKVARLRLSANFEARASYNLLRSETLWWKLALAILSAATAPLFLAAPLPSLALFTCVVAVSLDRYLFFVSVVPLSMALTFSGGSVPHGAAA